MSPVFAFRRSYTTAADAFEGWRDDVIYKALAPTSSPSPYPLPEGEGEGAPNAIRWRSVRK
jgi:hypothetical protein